MLIAYFIPTVINDLVLILFLQNSITSVSTSTNLYEFLNLFSSSFDFSLLSLRAKVIVKNEFHL